MTACNHGDEIGNWTTPAGYCSVCGELVQEPVKKKSTMPWQLNSNDEERFANRVMDFVDCYLHHNQYKKFPSLPWEFPQSVEAL